MTHEEEKEICQCAIKAWNKRIANKGYNEDNWKFFNTVYWASYYGYKQGKYK